MATSSATVAIAERPIIMGVDSVRAILRGDKTQTRRVVRPQPPKGWGRNCWHHAPVWGWTAEDVPAGTWHTVRCPYGEPGDRLWVREPWWLRGGSTTDVNGETSFIPHDKTPEHVRFAADCDSTLGPKAEYLYDGWARHPSIFLPRALARLVLEVTDIRAERLTDISPEDVRAEGYGTDLSAFMHAFVDLNHHRKLFDWHSPPWVWVVSFRRVAP